MTQQFKEPQIKEESIMLEKRLARQNTNKSATPTSKLTQYINSSSDSKAQKRFDCSFPPKTKQTEEQSISRATLKSTLFSLQSLITLKKQEHEQQARSEQSFASVKQSGNLILESSQIQMTNQLEICAHPAPQQVPEQDKSKKQNQRDEVYTEDDKSYVQKICYIIKQKNQSQNIKNIQASSQQVADALGQSVLVSIRIKINGRFLHFKIGSYKRENYFKNQRSVTGV